MMHLLGIVMFVTVLEWFIKVVAKEAIVEERSGCEGKCKQPLTSLGGKCGK